MKKMLLGLLLLTGCAESEREVEKEFDYESMVMNDDVEWTTGSEGEIAGELIPEPQEKLIREVR